MIKDRFIIDKYNWKVYTYYDTSDEDKEEILELLNKIKFPIRYIENAYVTLDKNVINSGSTYTQLSQRTSVIIITKTSNSGEFINSFVHEITHLTNHISVKCNIDTNSEEYCYLAGDTAQRMHRTCYKLMCKCCRKH